MSNNILFVHLNCASPPDDGFKIRSYNFIKELKLLGNVDFLRVDTMQGVDLEIEEHVINVAKPRVLEKIKSVINLTPWFISKNSDKKSIAEFVSFVGRKKYKRVHFDSVELFDYFVSLHNVLPHVDLQFDMRDALSRMASQVMFRKYKFSIRAMYRYFCLRKIENAICERSKTVFLLSDIDQNYLKRKVAKVNFSLVQNGVDKKLFSATDESGCYVNATQKKFVCFLGDYSYPPNIEAVDYIIEKLLPVTPDNVKIYFVGKNPTNKMLSVVDERVVVTGRVIDPSYYLRNAFLFVCPLFSGTGVKNKIIEAMASGCAVITTPLGAEGIASAEDNVLLISEPSDNFSVIYQELLINRAKAHDIGSRAVNYISNRYSWSRSAREIVA